MKLCKDCKHFNGDLQIFSNVFGVGERMPDYCMRTEMGNLVTGGRNYRTCSFERYENSDCGLQGWKWEPKE